MLAQQLEILLANSELAIIEFRAQGRLVEPATAANIIRQSWPRSIHVIFLSSLRHWQGFSAARHWLLLSSK